MKKGFMLFLAVSVVSLLAVSSLWAEVVRGKIMTMDLNMNKLSVQTTSGESLALSFDKEDFIVWKGDDEVEAKEIQVGSEAEVGYYADENGAKVASWVDLTPLAEATEEPEAAVEETAPEAGTEAAEPAAMAQPEAAEPATMTQPDTKEHPGTAPSAAKEHPGKEHPGN